MQSVFEGDSHNERFLVEGFYHYKSSNVEHQVIQKPYWKSFGVLTTFLSQPRNLAEVGTRGFSIYKFLIVIIETCSNHKIVYLLISSLGPSATEVNRPV